MNIFFLDTDPGLAARYHNDRHVNKMITESAQLLFTCMNQIDLEHRLSMDRQHWMQPIPQGKEFVKWLRQSHGNFAWLCSLAKSLNDEYRYRYGHDENHGSWKRLVDSGIMSPVLDFKKVWGINQQTPPHIGVTDDCRISNDPVQCYRQYYRTHKADLAKWTKRGEPEWWTEELL